jgi:hypothetical protein
MSDAEYIFRRPRFRYTASHFHLILSNNENTHSIFPNFWSHSLFPRFCGSTQLCGSSLLGSIISYHLVPTLLKLNLDGTQGENCKRVPKERIPTYGYSWLQHQSVCLN